MASRKSGKAVSGKQPSKAWAGRFREPTDRLVEAFTRSIAVDKRLYVHDIQIGRAHV